MIDSSGTSKRHKVNAMMAFILIKMLMDGSHTYEELTEATGLFHRTVRHWVGEGKRAGLIYIAEWEEDTRGYLRVPSFAWGPGKKDVVRKVKNSTQRSKDSRARRAARESTNNIVGRLCGTTA